jgi:hypothetical protein
MKKVIISLILVGAVLTAFAQTEDNYNPYRYEEWKTESEQDYVYIAQKFLLKECDSLELQAQIEKYNTTNNTQVLQTICWDYNCSEVIDFAIDLITTSSNEKARQIAIVLLGFRKYYDAIPLLLDHVKKEILYDEKITVASTLATLGRKTEALEILECNCYTMDYMDDECINSYFYSFDQSTAIKYFDYYFNKPETQLEAACWLARCGIYDKTFPLFVEFLKNNTTYERATSYSLVGLAAIGTEDAIEIIKQQTKNNIYLIARSATLILDRIEKGRREE